MDAVIRREIHQRAGGEGLRVRADRAGDYILDKVRAGRGAVGHIKLQRRIERALPKRIECGEENLRHRVLLVLRLGAPRRRVEAPAGTQEPDLRQTAAAKASARGQEASCFGMARLGPGGRTARAERNSCALTTSSGATQA